MVGIGDLVRGATAFAEYTPEISSATTDFSASLQFARFCRIGPCLVVQFAAVVNFAKNSTLEAILFSTPSTVKGAGAEHVLSFCSVSDSKSGVDTSSPGVIVAAATDVAAVEIRPSTKDLFTDGSGSISGTFVYLEA